MKYLLGILATLCISACFQFQNSPPVEELSTQRINTSNEETVLLMLTTGISTPLESISVDSLKTLVKQKKVWFTQKASGLSLSFFPNAGPIKEVKDFVKVSKNSFLICDLSELDPKLKVLSIGGKNFLKHDKDYFLSKGDALSLFQKDITQVSITGVTAITRSAGKLADTQGIAHLTAKLKDQFVFTDIMHMSNEVSLCDTCQYIGKTMKFCMKVEHAEALKTLGCDVIELTGNHNLDYGKTWYQKSLEWYRQNGIRVVGGGASPEEAAEPLVLTMKDGSKLGWLAFNETCPLNECADKGMGANRYSREKAEKAIQKLREAGVNSIVCGVQFGEWDKYEPHAGQVKIAKELVDLGVDLVYGTANHQIQQIQYYKGKCIYYGLGNFLFDQIHRIGVRQACFLHTYYYKGRMISIVPVFTFMEANRQNRLATPAEVNEMKKVIFNDSLLYK